MDRDRLGVIFGSAFSDLIIVILAFIMLGDLDSSLESSIKLMGGLQGLNSSEISPEMLAQLKEQTLPMTQFFTYLILGVFGFIHLAHYLAFYFEKTWANRYLKVLIISGALLSGLYVLNQLFHLDFAKAWVMLIFPSYMWAWICLRRCL
jgi:hypothetical protein